MRELTQPRPSPTSPARSRIGRGGADGVPGAVVVTADHRLGALGFLHLADLGGDWARAAQHRRFRWRPGQHHSGGQSAGVSCIGALLAAPSAAGPFHEAGLQSGRTSAFCDRATATAMAEDLIAAPSLDDAEGLRTISVRRILDR
ncbi:hypothetical protein ABZZ74_18185 [Streptomyces sp. NPDC006476]|uniref:hypothetical protein n=1 Tax=Streptomyces sp. NPDC006476 TaxID=3157175 RepID=UPI0033BF059A